MSTQIPQLQQEVIESIRKRERSLEVIDEMIADRRLRYDADNDIIDIDLWPKRARRNTRLLKNHGYIAIRARMTAGPSEQRTAK